MYNGIKETHVNRDNCVAMHTNYLLNFKMAYTPVCKY